MFSKKAAKQLKKLPKQIQVAATEAASPTGPFGAMLACSHKRIFSIRLPKHYRVLIDRTGGGEGEAVWVGTHEDYNKMVRHPGRI